MKRPRALRLILLLSLVAALVAAAPLTGTFGAPEAPLITGDLPAVNTDYLVFNDAGTYRVRKSLTGTLLGTTSTTNVGVVVNAAVTDIGSGSGSIGFLSGTYNVTTQIVLTAGVGLVGTGTEHASNAGRYTVLKAVSGFPTTQPMVTTSGAGGNSFLRQITLDGAAIAQSPFKAATDQPRLDDVGFRGGTLYSLWIAASQGIANMVDVGRGSGTAATGLWVEAGSDWNWVNTKVVDGSYTTVVKIQGSGQLFDNAHFTGGMSTTTNTINDGDRNRFVDVYFDSVTSGPLFENVSGNCSVTSGWFRAANLGTTNMYSMVKVSGGNFILNGTQGEAGTNKFKWGIETTAGATTVLGNQFRNLAQLIPWNTTPTAHVANTLDGTDVD